MLIDNKTHGNLLLELKKIIKETSKISVLSGKFSLYGFYCLQKEVSKLSGFRLMISCWDENILDMITGSEYENSLKNKLTQSYIAKQCSIWIKNNVEVKAITGRMEFPPQNMFHVKNENELLAFQGGSHFTASGLGAIKSDTYEINMAISQVDATKQLLGWYDNIWNDANATKNVKNEFIKYLDYLSEEKTGDTIYFITLQNIFKNHLNDLDQENIIRSKTGFKETLIWKKLYKFQRDGVLGAIEKLEKYNGCIIADSVGLGKTFEGLAIIKYYELRNDKVLVLCPLKLRENWALYTNNDKRNLLAEDRFNFDVLNHSDLSRKGGKSGEINLETLNWGNYDLVVIDESHNFRNNNIKTDGITRYQQLMDNIIRSGVKTKVLMISATPVNNRMNDLKNQVAFITAGKDNLYFDSGIASIENTLKNAQTKFNQWLKLPEESRKTDGLLESMNFDYFKLLDLLTIARSRKHIEKYYDSSEIGKFPERLKPMNVKSDIDISGKFPALKDINRSIKKLNLAAYAPMEYVRMEKKSEYSIKYDQEVKGGKSVFRQIDRERSLIHLMRVNLLKRMESSINSFSLTVGKIYLKLNEIIEKIDNHENSELEKLSISEIEIDDHLFEDLLIGNKTKILIQDMDLFRWKQDLEEDMKLLKKLHEDSLMVDSQKDAKLQKLKEIISYKTKNPFNSQNKKVIIFTAFADTAHYLYKNLSEWANDELKINSALITGSGSNNCTIMGIKKDINNLLTNFSPISKERNKIESYSNEEIDILIATDCISEGQNLQDCDMLINYDIHWNPVRIIQRFGRIDRLGSINGSIQLTNFWPNIELDEYINLESRVSGRMVLLDISATGEENIINYEEKKYMNDLEYRRKQMKQLQNAVIDLEEMDGGLSITDITLNDFRIDLSSFINNNFQKSETSCTGFYSVVRNNIEGIEIPGAIFCLRDVNSKVEDTQNYGLDPYYLVYVAENGEIILNHAQTKKILDLLRKISLTNNLVDKVALDKFNSQTINGKKMANYEFMLEKAIDSIVGKKEEKGVQSLFTPGGTTFKKDNFYGIKDFEVITFLIIKD